MWPWMKRWRGWVMRNVWPLSRHHAALVELRHGYERGGLAMYDRPVPWGAEVVVVEATLRLPATASRRREDFLLRHSGAAAAVAEQVRRAEGEGHYRATFRLPPPGRAVRAAVVYKSAELGQIDLPYLGPDELLRELRLESPTLFARLGGESVACRAVVASQCQGVIASALLACPSGLLPVADLDLQVEFSCERTGWSRCVPVRLTPSQRLADTALVTVMPGRRPRRVGLWTVTWLAGGRALARQHLRALSKRQFHRSLKVADAAFVSQQGDGPTRLTRQLPSAAARAGPCFFVTSTEAGMAGLCRFQLAAVVPGAVRAPMWLEQDVLIGDGPTAVLPGTLDAADLAQLSAFELSCAGRSLGTLPLCAVPAATFTAEGGYLPPTDFAWGAAAEEEIKERLSRLMEGPPPPPAR